MSRWPIFSLLAALACNGPGDSDPVDTDVAVDTDDTGPVDADGDGFLEGTDCNDNNDAIFPGAPELCNEVDDDCNDMVDDEAIDATTFYGDVDLDGFGNADVTMEWCTQPEGYVENAEDCDDDDPLVHPDADEAPCDGVDNNCDNSVDLGNIAINDDFELAAVMDSATDSAVYCLAEGTYTGGATITSDVTLVGVGNVLITGEGENILHFENADAVLQGVTISGSGRAFDVDGGSLTLEDVEISNIEYDSLSNAVLGGVGRLQSASLHAYGLTVTDVDLQIANQVQGLFYITGAESEFELTDFSIRDNVVTGGNNTTGLLYLNDDASVSLTDGEISGNVVTGTAGHLMFTQATGTWDNVRIVDNQAIGAGSSNAWLIDTRLGWDASHLVLADNTIHCTDGQVGGVNVLGGSNSLTNSILSGNEQSDGTLTYGWFMLTASTLSLINVDIVANHQAPYVYSGALFYANNWEGNTSLALTNTAITDNVFGQSTQDEGEADILLLSYGAVTQSGMFYHGNSDDTLYYESSNHQITESEDGPGYTDTSAESTADWNLYLANNSPLRDSGSGEIMDADGSPSDIGAYGGPGGVW